MEEIHFITPENIKFSVPVSDIYSFCEKYCEEYISKSEENKEKFLEFKKKYTYFSPYYDFLICSLKWIIYPSLID